LYTIIKEYLGRCDFDQFCLLELFMNIDWSILRNEILQSIPPECNMEKGKEYDDTIGYTIVVSVSASCSRCYNFVSSS